ncbi:MAG: PPOX class F420-dependent oxidoreductase [Acidimicrobiales bacterium]
MATTHRLTIDDARAYLAEHHRAVLHTYRRDGAPQLSPVAVGVDAEGRVIISTRDTAMKTKNLERDPRAAVCAFPDAWTGRWLQVDGTVEIVRRPDAIEALVDYYRRVAGEHPDWDDYRAAMDRDRRVLLRLTIERVGPTVSG